MNNDDLILNDGLSENVDNKFQRKFQHFIRKTFPHLTTEVIIIVSIISVLTFSFTFRKTATVGHEMEIMAQVSNQQDKPQSQLEIVEQENKEVEFEVNDVNTGITKDDALQDSYQPYEICFIGDDRVVDMENSILTETRFIAEQSANAEWFKTNAINEFKEISKDIKVCVVSMGLNELINSEVYIEELNKLATQHSNIQFVYSNIGPIQDAEELGFTNADIEEFNKQMANGLDENWVIFDTYAYLNENGFDSSNDVQYSLDTSASVFVWIVNGVSPTGIDTSIKNITETVENEIYIDTE